MGCPRPIDIDFWRTIPDEAIQKAYFKGNIKAFETSFLNG
jgi:hypothetical protein